MFRRITLAFLALSALAQDQPTFRSGTRLVEMNVIVRNGKGPVTGLTKADFTILDQGKPRTISLFSVTSSSSSSTSSTAARPSETQAVPLPPGAVSNRWNGRGELQPTATILLIDRLNTDYVDQLYANNKIIEFLRKNGNSDRLAIYLLGQELKVLQELTDDPKRVEGAVKNLKPQNGKGVSSDNLDPTPSSPAAADGTQANAFQLQADLARAANDKMMGDALGELQEFVIKDRVERTRAALMAIAKHVAPVPGRKNLIWVSSSFPFMITTKFGPSTFDTEVNQATRALSDANIAMYSVDARGLAPSGYGTSTDIPAGNLPKRGSVIPLPGILTGVDTMNRFADFTGGVAYYNNNGLDDSIQKAVKDAEVSYNVGFYVPEEEFTGQFHKLSVKVNRKGVDVRARNGYFASKVPPLPVGTRPLPDLLTDPIDALGVGLTALATPDPAASDTYHVQVRIALQDIHLELQAGRWAGTVKLSIYPDGAPSVHTTTHKLDIPDAQMAAALETGFGVDASVKVEAKSEGIRVVAQDGVTGTAGSVRLPLRRAANAPAK